MRRGEGGAGARPLAPLPAALVVFAAIGFLYLAPYVLRDLKFPVGFDAAFYVRRANAASLDGLDRLGAVRAGTALLTAVLMKASGQNPFTMVAVVTAVLSGVAALGAVGMTRVAFHIGPLWVPIIGFLLWAGFGYNGIYIHLDNLLNASLVLCGFAVAVGAVAWGRGAVAFALLMAAAGLAHWSFYVFSVAVFLGGVALFALWQTRTGGDRATGTLKRLMASVAGSAAFVGLTFLVRSPEGRLLFPRKRGALRLRFFAHLREPFRYLAVPLAAVGGFATLTGASASERGRRFLVSLLTAWLAVTVAAGLAQAAGLPTAGGRLLNFLFPIPLLAGIGLWWGARKIVSRPRLPFRRAVAVALVVGVTLGFGAMAWGLRYDRSASFERAAVEQVAEAAGYVDRFAPDRTVVYLISPTRRGAHHFWNVIRSALPPEQAARAQAYRGTLGDFLAGHRSQGFGDAEPPSGAVAILIARYNPFDEAALRYPDRVVAPGVLVLVGPIPSAPLPPQPSPGIDTGATGLGAAGILAVAVLIVVGGGWSIALLPADALFRIALAPGLGVGAIILSAFAWDRLGLPFKGAAGLIPMVVSAVVGWGVAALRSVPSDLRPGGAAPATPES